MWWIECLEVLRLTDGTGILNAPQKGTLYTAAPGGHLHTHTHTRIHNNSYCNKTHTCMQANTHMHSERQTLLCIFTNRMAYALRLFVMWQCAWVVLGIMRGITGLILSQGCRLLPLRFPPPQMKVAAEVEDGMQVFQLLNSSKLFDLLSSNCKSQVADSPVYEPSCCISPLACAALWPDKTCALSNKWILRSFCQLSRGWRREILTHLRVWAAHPIPFFKTVSISTIYCLIINTQRCSKHEIIHGYPALNDRSMNLM